MAYLQTEVISHTRKVCSLYKKAVRTVQCWYPERAAFRFQAVLMRQRFEENRKEKNVVKIQELIENAEKELFLKQHYQPMKFPYSPGGVAHGRELTSPDWVLDFWHPEEKARYPEYFARREQRKKEYLEYWEKKFGKAEEQHHH